MTARLIAAGGCLLVLGGTASAHRLDEYLQATTISISQRDVRVQMRLTPGIAVYRHVVAEIDTNRDGVVSATEQSAYVQKVLGDLSLSIDGVSAKLSCTAETFPKLDDMKKGLGEIQLDLEAPLSTGGRNRSLVFQNHHESKIAAYLVNCLVPEDPALRVTGQKRNFLQSRYEMSFVQAIPAAAKTSAAPYGWLLGGFGLFALFSFQRQQRVRVSKLRG